MRVERLDEIQTEKIVVEPQIEKLGDRLSANFTSGEGGKHIIPPEGYEHGTICGENEIYITKKDIEYTKTIIIAAPGSGGSDTIPYKTCVNAATDINATSIFTVPVNLPTEEVLAETYKEVIKAYGDTVNVVIAGHSGGAGAAAIAVASLLEEGYKFTNPPTIVMLDAFNCKPTDEQLKLLAKNNIPIVAYYQADNDSYYNRYIEYGVDLLKIKDLDITNGNHDQPLLNFFNNEKKLMDFILKKEYLEVGPNGYNIEQWINGKKIYPPEAGEADISKINLIIKEYLYTQKKEYLKNLRNPTQTSTGLKATILSIDNTLFDSSIDEMITKISNTSYISSNINDLTIGSSSNAISKISDLTSNYYQTTTDLLFSIANELQEFKKISPNIFKAENRIAKKLSELNEGIEFFQYNTPFENEQQDLNSNDDAIYLGRQN